MRRTRTVVVVMCSVAIAAASLGSAAGAATAAKKKPKLKCSTGAAAIKEIEPLFDINANAQNTFEQRVGVVQFGNLKAVKNQIHAVDANNPVADVRAKPMSNVVFPDKRSATGGLTIEFGGGANHLDQGTQFFMCAGKDQGGTKTGAWRITLYSICNLYQLNPCSDALVTKALDALSPALLALAKQ